MVVRTSRVDDNGMQMVSRSLLTRALLRVDEFLAAGEELTSEGGLYRCTLMGDGNLVLIGCDGILWSTGTGGTGADRLVLQGDGNIVLYARALSVWESDSTSDSPEVLVLQEDGNLVSYDWSRRPFWSSATGPVAQPKFRVPIDARSSLLPGQVLYGNQALYSPQGQFRATMRFDGNLVVEGLNGVSWSTGTSGAIDARLILQEDGNLVLERCENSIVWESRSHDAIPGELILQDDGNLVIYSRDGSVMWSAWSS
jgi:hypothetical protein